MGKKSMLLSVPSVQVKLKEVKSQFLLSFFVIIKFCLQALYIIDAPETANGHFQIGKFMDVSPDS